MYNSIPHNIKAKFGLKLILMNIISQLHNLLMENNLNNLIILLGKSRPLHQLVDQIKI